MRGNEVLASLRALGCSIVAVAAAAWMFATDPARAQASDTKSAFAPAVAATQAAKTASGADADDEKAKFKY